VIAQSSSRHQVPAAPWLHAQAHWCRRCQWWMRTQSAAQAPSGRSTKHSRLQSPGSTLPACRTPKQQACSQRQGPVSCCSADAGCVWSWLCSSARSKQSALHAMHASKQQRGARGGHGVLKSIWMQRPARRQMRLFVSPPRSIHRSAGNAEASAASGSVLDRLGGATCAQPSYVRL
jgi:hypothetical protein